MITVSHFLIVYLKCVKQVLLTVAKRFVLFLQYKEKVSNRKQKTGSNQYEFQLKFYKS